VEEFLSSSMSPVSPSRHRLFHVEGWRGDDRLPGSSQPVGERMHAALTAS
jgi:hypothetical protein